jgi:hypothetical protein
MALGITIALLCSALPSAPDGSVYRNVVARALERAQAGVYAGLDFEVDHSRWADPWIVTSAHYEVRTTHSYVQARRIADGLEFMYGEFVKLLGEPSTNSSRKRPVWILPTRSNYNAEGNDIGADHSSMLGSFYAFEHEDNPVITYQANNQTLQGMWVTHSALHQFLVEGFGPQNHIWIDEGLAAYFSLFWDWNFGATELKRIQDSGQFISLERLVDQPLAAYGAAPQTHFIELGMLLHFLLNSCEATRNGVTGDPSTGPFQEFLRMAVRGQDLSETEFLETFQEAADLLEEDFRDFQF